MNSLDNLNRWVACSFLTHVISVVYSFRFIIMYLHFTHTKKKNVRYKMTSVKWPLQSILTVATNASEVRVILLPPERCVGNGGKVWAVRVVLPGVAADGQRLSDPHWVRVVVSFNFPAAIRPRKICSVHNYWNPITKTNNDITVTNTVRLFFSSIVVITIVRARMCIYTVRRFMHMYRYINV